VTTAATARTDARLRAQARREADEERSSIQNEPHLNGHDFVDPDARAVQDGPPPEFDRNTPPDGTAVKFVEGEEWPVQALNLIEIINREPPPRDWFAWERLLAGRGHGLTGIGGSSKTRFQVQMGIGCTCGRMLWDWRIERTGSGLLLLTEDTAQDVWGPINATIKALGLDKYEREAVIGGLHVFPLAGEDCRLLTVDPARVMVQTDLAYRLLKRCEATPNLQYIGLDPAIRLTDGEEANPLHQRRLGDFADGLAIRTGACAMLSMHAAKALQTSQEIVSHASRGSGAITDALRAEFVMRTMTPEEARARNIDEADRKQYVQLVCTKGNHVPPSAMVPIWLRRSTWGVLMPADELQQPTPKTDGRTLNERHTKALRILGSLNGGNNVGAGRWREALLAEGLIQRSNEKGEGEAFRRLITPLRDHGLINSTGRGKSVAYAITTSSDGILNAADNPCQQT